MPQQKTTLADIAERLGLSKSAVSLALQNSKCVSAQTRKTVAKTAREMGYVRNELVSSMMASIKRGVHGKFSETIAVLNGNSDERALKKHPTLPKYYAGIKDEAKRLGYCVNEFWLGDPNLKPSALARAMRSRGIRGGVVIGHSANNVFPDEFAVIWRDFYFISVGIKTQNPTLEMVSADHYAITYRAVRKLLERGFKRPALVLDRHVDGLVDGRFVAGFMRAQCDLAQPDVVRPFTMMDTDAGYAAKMRRWLLQSKPDVILYLLDSERLTIEGFGDPNLCAIPLVQLERRGYVADWCGMEQNNDTVGRVAIRRLCDVLNRNCTRSGEERNLVTLVPPTWVD